jgi:uncharacterized membrane protein
MKITTDIAGMVLIVLGILVLAFQGFNYTKSEKIVQVGDLQITAHTKENVKFPPLLGGLSIAAGVIILFIGRKNKK